MPKKITMTTKPQGALADDWVAGTTDAKPTDRSAVQTANSKAEAVALKRLTIDIPEELHTRIKSQCALRRTKMTDEIRKLLEDNFAGDA